MDLWSISVAGIVVLNFIGLVFIIFDIRDSHTDLVRVTWWYPPPSIEYEQANSVFMGQLARAATLILIAALALWELLPLELPREGIVAILYLVVIVKVVDSIRARRARKNMVGYLESSPGNGMTPNGDSEAGPPPRS